MIHESSSAPEKAPTVLVVMGSIRAGRRCTQIGSWVLGIAEASSHLQYELLDLADWPLPMFDEPGIPAGVPHLAQYTQSHTLAWSSKIGAAAAFVFVTPQYNWGYPAALKNAIDHLYHEWKGKPAVIVTYGGHGGTKCAAQLRQVAEAVHLRPVPTMPAITLAREVIEGAPLDPAKDFAPGDAESIRQAIRELSEGLARVTAEPS